MSAIACRVSLFLALAAAARADPAKEIKLASAGFHLLAVAADAGDFYGNHLAQQLDLMGLRVITPGEVQALVGMERQRQLLGCTGDSACIMELANALGVDGVLMGDLGKFGTTYQVNLRLVSNTGALLAGDSFSADGDKELLSRLSEAARKMAPAAAAAMGRPLKTAAAEPARNVISLKPGALVERTISAEYMRVLGPSWALTAMPLVGIATDESYGRSEALGIGMGLHWFPSAEAPRGWFVYGEVRLEMLLILNSTTYSGGTSTAVLAGGGYSWLIRDVFYVSAGLALGPRLDVLLPRSGGPADLKLPLRFEPRVNAGFAF